MQQQYFRATAYNFFEFLLPIFGPTLFSLDKMSGLDSLGKCAVCGVDATLKCTACRLAFYCGADHQRQHWKVHKLQCRPFEIDDSERLGRHIVATRDIPANSVLFVEAPLVCGPKWSLEDFEKEVPVFPCVGCFRPVHIGDGHQQRCDRCTWPVCSTSCAGLTDPHRHGVECAVLALHRPSAVVARGSDLHATLDFYRSDALLALRALLLQVKYPQRWAQLSQLQSHEAERFGTQYYE